jgi:hypothetical protein
MRKKLKKNGLQNSSPEMMGLSKGCGKSKSTGYPEAVTPAGCKPGSRAGWIPAYSLPE